MSIVFAPEVLSVPNGFHRLLHDIGKEVLQSQADTSQDICVVAARLLKEQIHLREHNGRDPYTGEPYVSDDPDGAVAEEGS